MGHHVLNDPLPEGSLFSSAEYDEIWKYAEEKAAFLLSRIQPSKRSEECRKGVINYVRSLLERELQCKVFSFGSVPLKTYLPDGDIDLTAVSLNPFYNQQHHIWAERVCQILEHEERIHVKEVKCIHAEVPVVKCLVENLIVDITFNQLGGLSTLCFLEEVDKLIGKDHLFKRSIILVKAWCFYESRILGAHHGLLSTYALEVLVLYIFHVYHHSLRGPLEVLYRFIRFFSKFDWEEYCLSPSGPIRLDELHKMSERAPPSSHGNVLLSDEFLSACREKYGTLSENNQGKIFSRKFMNLVDPLRPFNNLGRSVNSGNLVRIYSAFAYGAARLEKLLQSSKEHTCENLALFFRNTQKHCEGQRPDAGFLSFQGDTLCNGKLRTGGSVSIHKAISGNLNYMDKSKCRNGIEIYADKPSFGDLTCASLCMDGPKQSNLDACSKGMVVHNNEDHKDNGHGGLPDKRYDPLRSDVCLNVNSVVTLSGSSPWSEPQARDSCLSIQSSPLVSKESKEDSGSQKVMSSLARAPKLNSALLDLSETALAVSEEELPLQQQAVSSDGDFRDHMQFECRETDAAILEGDYDAYLDNLRCGRDHQVGLIPRQSHINSGIFSWGDPGRSMLLRNTRGRNIPIHGGAPCLPNGGILANLPKNQKGTGTFLPTVNTNFERDRRGYANGVRSPRRNMDSYNSTSYNILSASKSRSNVPRRRDGANRTRSQRITEQKAGENQELSSEDAVIGSVQSPRLNISDDFSLCLQRHANNGLETLMAVDCSLMSPKAGIVVGSHSNKDISIDNLEFGSFGPGFLASGLRSPPENRDHIESVSPSQHLSPPVGSLEARNTTVEAGNHANKRQSAYCLKEEDFPPLPLAGPTAAGVDRAALHTQGSYHQACLLNHLSSPTKIA